MSLPYRTTVGSMPLSGTVTSLPLTGSVSINRTAASGYATVGGYANVSSARVLPAAGYKAAMPVRVGTPTMLAARTISGGIAQPVTFGTSPVCVTSQATVVASEQQLPIGSQVPSVEIDCGFPPEKVNMYERTKGKRVILVGLPGAFTPT
jgi:hypothetical protein